MDFETLYQTYWPKVFRLCMGYMNDHDAAQDVAQEVFIKVWENLPKFRNEAAIGTWIFRIASNHCLRQIKNNQRIPQSELPPNLKQEPPTTTNEKMEFLYRCIAELPEMERLIISLELEDVKQAEIAEIVGISAGNVRVKIHRIKEKLTQKFKHYG